MGVTLPDIEAEQAALQVLARCDVLAAISESPEGLTRVYLSPEHLRANRQVGEWMQAVGMQVWQDTVGNICGRYEGRQPDAPAILLGSHLDTVRNAGRYDGMLGVLTALEVVGYLHRHQQRLPVAIEVIGFADEEGTRFGITLLGSKGVTGCWPVEWLNTTDADGISVAQAMVRAGLDPMDIGQSARAANAFCAYLELHIEQGPCLEKAGLALGVVTDINGARRLQCQFTGLAGHAGTVPMGQRQDALAGAAEWMCAVEALTAAQGEHLVATVGTLTCLPGAVNVIPGQVRLTLDIRGPNDRGVNDLLTRLLAEAEAIATRRGITFAAEGFYRIKATACDSALQQCISQSISQVQGRCLALPSGAGHDAIAMAECWPVGMLFVRCKGGVSHHPDESVTSSDVAVAIQAYLEAVLTSPSSPSSLTPQRC
ncbi:allantoate amidohydrolase [Yersinia pseudotuberculosis]|uniref:allantoate amidohydrolase n=1 Tax=Yersinia pseudotuberculosis TaxID=633 RepID=UPI0003494233|nr:allantoate amidohydrolase [Yersinia pseudotuberculosis]QES97344.1 allantoate amidohydrolase [Yersinia pseudotuberculosis]CFU85562.1 allantoate amidohydrolase [Yersinia pseudotuberculosis]CNB16420.1 allantoate amidohydrolase [Yersinia pseudotuberculosis]CRY57980.1 allantoate amidohydrolase [Yersinia pseudotuberculosis]SUB31056.1 hydrolase [Yersinia pseudotuberculosis]